MRNTDYFKDKSVTILGLARSGLACANLLYDLGAIVSVTENADNESTRMNASRLKSKDIKVELGGHSREFIRGRDLLVISPGIPDTSLPVIWAREFNIPIISEIEAAWILCPAEVIAITGTNGKTTVTTLLARLLERDGRKVFVCGNIGNPFSGEVARIQEGDFVSLEVSSFQLEKIRAFKPRIAVILNLSRNHLDRYADMQDYLSSKKRIFMNQDESDYLVLNFQDPVIRVLAKEAKSNIVYFSKDARLNPNFAACITVGSILGIDKRLAMDVFKEFKGIEHRLEYVGEIGNIKFINDSKATTVDSTIWALENMSKPVILISGGREKGNDYSLIRELVRNKVKEFILIGEARDKIRREFEGLLPVNEAVNLEEAVNVAFNRASAGDSVLFSPMCKSFDMFANYEERGKMFKQAVSGLRRIKVRDGP